MKMPRNFKSYIYIMIIACSQNVLASESTVTPTPSLQPSGSVSTSATHGTTHVDQSKSPPPGPLIPFTSSTSLQTQSAGHAFGT
jgi:hypothetical protein